MNYVVSMVGGVSSPPESMVKAPSVSFPVCPGTVGIKAQTSKGGGPCSRGGGWLSSAKGCRSSSRSKAVPSRRFGYQGFRLLLSEL